MTRTIVVALYFIFFAGADTVLAADRLASPPSAGRPQLALNPYRLVEAARDGHTEEVRALIDQGVEVNFRTNPTALTALMNAANQGYLEIVDLLLKAGADPSLSVAGQWTALQFAVQNGQLPVVERLLRAEPRPTPGQIDNALLTAARTGHPQTAATLVAAGADANVTDPSGMTPLALAAKWGYPQTAKRLLALNGDPARPDHDGRTPLMWASWQGHGQIVDLLLEAGADPAPRDRSGDSAFMDATSPEAVATLMANHSRRIAARPEACSLLIGFGLLANVPDHDPAVTGYGLYRAPEVGSSAWVVPHSQAAPISLRVTERLPSEYPENSWDADFEPPPRGALDGLPVQQNATLVWTPRAAAPARITPRRAQLPWGVFPETVRAALDLDGDDSPEVLDLSYCCGDPTTNEGCEDHCSEYWQEKQDSWLKCEAAGPA